MVRAGKSMSMVNNEAFIKALRSSGYRDAAMALGELMDNSLQAGAKNVDLLIKEQYTRVHDRKNKSWDILEIGIMDDGCGMDAELVQKALVLGEGTHRNDKKGMGKFGVGLPSASISQCKRVDVWSWKNGIDSAMHTFIDLTSKSWRRELEIHPATEQDIPFEWIQNSGNISKSKSGTLVVWSVLDRLSWKKSETIYTNSEFLIGRMYRQWLKTSESGDSQAKIRFVPFDWDENHSREIRNFTSNDPMYMIPNSAGMESKTGRKCIFKKYGDVIPKKYKVEIEDDDGNISEELAEVNIRFSIAPKELRSPWEARAAGSLDYGQHAKKNQGVSILRAGRELKLETKWIDKDPRNRWFGAEVEFMPILDNVMGVASNKQEATNLSKIAGDTFGDYTLDDETAIQAKMRIKEEDYQLYILLDISSTIQNNITNMLKRIKKEKSGTTGGKKGGNDGRHPEDIGTGATKERKETSGNHGTSDEEENLDKEERIKRIMKFIKDRGSDEEGLQDRIEEFIDSGLKYQFEHSYVADDAFFTVDAVAGAILMTLNTNHIAYDELFEVLNQTTKDKTDIQLKEMVTRANTSILVMLIAWARIEDEAQGNGKMRLKDARNDWGRMARDFLLYGKEE
ncbi:MAG: ATP-binding protein [Rhodobacteraceae bacterium]|nr:ATP-binding protein [Paracoccaceae bacterium]